MPKKKKAGRPAAEKPQKRRIDRRILTVRITAVVLALLIAGSALSVLFFGHG